eukprot:SAG11_NODE_12471_length_701_cov_1.393688_1_plen_34_part_01
MLDKERKLCALALVVLLFPSCCATEAFGTAGDAF